MGRSFSMKVCGVVAGALGMFGAVASADTIQLVDPVTGADSGWQASFADGDMVTLVVDAVTDNAVFIQKFVDFQGPIGPSGLLPAVNIDFVQTASDANTVPTIVIVDEVLTNLQGADWGGFVWTIPDKGEAYFNVSDSAGFSTSPFGNAEFSQFADGDDNLASQLLATGGTVADGETYFPGAGAGELYIDVDLSQADVTSFVLKERPVPEPACVAILAIGMTMMRRRRNR